MRIYVAAACILACACSSTSSGSNSTDGDASTATDAAVAPTSTSPDAGIVVTCQNDSRVDTFVANLSKTSAAGMKVTLVSGDPAPPIRGMNTWVVKIADASGNAVTGASLTITPFMPDHGHGTTETPIATPNADGTYSITPLYFFMPGVWRTTIATPTDQVQFFFCVAG